MVIALSSPVLVGIYKDGELIDSYKKESQTSEILPVIFEEILHKYEIKRLFYTRGPGSFMAIKVTYLFLKTLSIVKDIKLLATEGFSFNENRPIRALKKVYFVKNNDKIVTKIYKDEIEQKFFLPKTLDEEIFSEEIEPLYVLPAV